MEFSAQGGELARQRSGCIVVAVHEGDVLSTAAEAIDRAAGGALHHALGRGDLERRPGATLLLHDLPGVAAERVLLVRAGPPRGGHESGYRTVLAAAVRALLTTGAMEATLCLHELAVAGRGSAWKIEQGVLAVMDGLYRFDQLKREPAEPKAVLERMVFHTEDAAQAHEAEAAIAFAAAVAEGVMLARDLGNMPGNLCTPTYLADLAHEFGKQHRFTVSVLERDEMEHLGMGAFLAVARGSLEPPKLIVMEHRGGRAFEPPVVLVGKGITFDAGGISIKPALEMDEMKFDMCGAASVFGAMRTAALLRLPLNVVAVVPATENMPSGNATKPGDIVTTLSGLSVEILDTDSEGRLALCDALTYAARFSPAAVVDVATLTGEIVTALGDVATGMFSNDDALAAEVVAAGNRAWDRVWRMPLWDDYQAALTSNFADLPNIGSQADCAVTAACFLSRFTRGIPWVHLDIAGTAARTGADKGATGRPVPLLAHFLAARAASTR
jgi:leucyl aminopeptidase